MPVCPAMAGLRSAFVFAAYEKYASFLMFACKQVSQTARASHLRFFEQPAHNDFFNNLLIVAARIRFLDSIS
jgi:hypothetical protein